MIEILSQAFAAAQQLLFESMVQPLVFALGGGSILEDAFAATGWLLVGLLEIVVMLLVIAPLQRWRPIQRRRDAAAVRVDVIYTLIHRLGLFRVAMFFAFDPLWNSFWGWLAVQGVSGWQLDSLLATAWPGVADSALASFLVYLVVFDLANYLIHRGQHQFDWWWALHAVHHSQRDMTMWTDNRNHLLDSVIVDILIVQLGHAIGVAPGQFVAVVAFSQLLESLSHANLRLSFGWLGERLLVSPRFHRLHHGIGVGHESQGKGTLGGHNFSVLFPVWDLLAGTASFAARDPATGIRDQLPEEGGRDYGRGFWSQQRLGLQRLRAALTAR
ncbi:sterol desaturase/sphingolipid hydroxylase (fatty acid hydroxylase superfamily) [Sphaerotilus hippei]|uniref:Sterol desaturase/sphingolipid hydroxylase (Fatty acid hydroxylase superfamily) n=1 Tax=Sphaerotilus hippei TaxID=744406 RepID=A0A318H8W5_9BURK|nr:sterol desaturase family protein [Sphaerotilus hippei]PXW94558.1 sterol desaturase/sphingolipid hydroxylase (fatty acid hydroxylase superfamily) [Sphaerotilus hippei]